MHINQERFQCEIPREKRSVLRERKEALGSPVNKADRVEGRSWFQRYYWLQRNFRLHTYHPLYRLHTYHTHLVYLLARFKHRFTCTSLCDAKFANSLKEAKNAWRTRKSCYVVIICHIVMRPVMQYVLYALQLHTTCMGGDLAPNLGGPNKFFAAQFQEKFPFSG